jgi:hypothetical protein
MMRKHLVIGWLAVTTVLLAGLHNLWPSRAIAAAGLLGSILLILAIQETSKRRIRTDSEGKVAEEIPKPQDLETFQKRDLEEY